MMPKSIAEHRVNRILNNFIVTEIYVRTRGLLIAFISIRFWPAAEGVSSRKDGSFMYNPVTLKAVCTCDRCKIIQVHSYYKKKGKGHK
jgi:hypothetical protein